MTVRAPLRSRRGPIARTLVVCAAALLMAAAADPLQQPTFRSTADVIAVDVRVVDGDGQPVPGLGPERFDVRINGKRRRVVSADFVRLGTDADARSPTGPAPRAESAPARGRTFVLAIDQSSFEVGAAKRAADAALGLVNGLSPADRVGLFVYPAGARVEPTTDRVAVRTALAGVIGIRSVLRSQYNLRPSEIVDITAQSVAASASSVAARGRATLDAASALTDPAVVVQQRECPTDPECVSRIFSEASALALHLEGQAAISLGGLEQVIRALGVLPGQKAVVLLSAGVLVSDRPGGRPDVGDVARPMGQMAAEAGVSVYTVHVDPSFSGLYSATKRRSSGDERDRDRGMLGQWLEAFSAAAGGTLIHVPVGGGEFAFDRILRETSAQYLLGVEPDQADRDGRARQLRVTVGARGVTVRSRQWVVVPRSGS
jgi:VWFA-related protein